MESLSTIGPLAEAPVPVLREGRVVRHLPIETEPAEPPGSEVNVNLFAKAPLRTDAEKVPNQEHSDHELGQSEGRPVEL